MPDVDEKAIQDKLDKDPSGSTLTKEETQYVMSKPNLGGESNEQSDPDADSIPDSEFQDVDENTDTEKDKKEETSASEKKDDKTSSTETGKEEKSEGKKPEEKPGETGKSESQKKEEKKPEEEKPPEEEGTFLVRLEKELAKEEGAEDLSSFTAREKGLFYQLRATRRRAQRAETEADGYRFKEIKDRRKREEEESNKEEKDTRDPEDFITVKDSKELSKNLSESAKKSSRVTFIAIAQMNARDRIDARRERGEDLPDYDEVMELGEAIVETNDEYKAKIYEAYLKGKNLALVTYDLIRKDPRFPSLFKPGKTSQKPPEKKEEKKPEEKKPEEKKTEDKTKEGKETQEKIDKNQKKAKTSAVYGGGGEGEESKQYGFEELMAMTPTQFKRVPKRIRDQFLKDAG